MMTRRIAVFQHFLCSVDVRLWYDLWERNKEISDKILAARINKMRSTAGTKPAPSDQLGRGQLPRFLPAPRFRLPGDS